MMNEEYQGPLEGLRVLDFGHYYAGPMVGMLLADQGATVIRVAKPGDAELPEEQYRLLNRNKQLLALDLKSEEGKAQALALIERADVLIENFRPGVMARLGLDYTSVKKANPQLVYLSLPGFSSKDTARAGIRGWEGVLSAAAGVFVEASGTRHHLGFPHAYTWVPLCSAFGSMHGAVAIMAALNAREERGHGTVIEVPLVEAGMSIFTDHFLFRWGFGPYRADPCSDDAFHKRLEPFMYNPADSEQQQIDKLEGVQRAMGLPAWYLTKDGRYMLVYGGKQGYTDRLYKKLGLYDQLRREGFTNDNPWDTTGVDSNLSGTLSLERQRRLDELVRAVLKSKTAAEWQTILEQDGPPFSIVGSREEWMMTEPLLTSGLFVSLGEGQDEIRVPGRVVDISGPGDSVMAIAPSEAKKLTAEKALVLLSGPVSSQTAFEREMLKKGDLLKGLKVLDLANIVAGPASSYILAQYGANVIKLEPPVHHDTPLNIRITMEVGQGKRNILVDFKTAPGREVFERLVKWADVVVHNILDDTAVRLGVSHAQLKKINPNIISCQLSCFGASLRDAGGWEDRRGHDGEVQLPSGIMTRFGTPEQPLFHGGISNDMMGGTSLAFSSLVALYQFRKTGYAGEGRGSLARATNYNQMVHMVMKKGQCDWGEAHGPFTRGPAWYQRMYECRDGWVYVGCDEIDAADLARLVTGGRDASEAAMEKAMLAQPTAHWESVLNDAGIGCHKVVGVGDICDEGVRCVDNEAADEVAGAHIDIIRRDDHPCGIPMIHPAPTWVRVGEEHSYCRLAVAPRRGEHTRKILEELGYEETYIAELYRLGIAHDYIPAMGSKDKYFFQPENWG